MNEDVQVQIVVDKKKIETNEFVQNVIGKAIAGAISALKGVNEDWKEIEVTVQREK